MTEPQFAPIGASVASPRQAASSLRRWLAAAVAGVLVAFAVSRVWILLRPDLGAGNLPVGLVVGSVATGLVAHASSVRGWILAVLLTITGLILLIAAIIVFFIAAAG